MTDQQPTDRKTRAERLAVFTIVEREGAKDYWLRVGDAYTNHDGSINLFLPALPVNGRLQVRKLSSAKETPPPAEPAA